MADYTEEQFKEAARKALAAGDTATAKKLIARARAAAQQGMVSATGTAGATKTPQEPPQAGDVMTLQDGSRMVFDPKTGSYTSAELMAGNMQPGIGLSAMAGAQQGFTFGWGDELAGQLGVSPLAVERGRATFAASQRDNPGSYLTGAIAGGVTAAGTLARMPGVARVGSALGGASLGARTVAGVTGGAALGGIQGAGEANPGDRMAGARQGAMIGGAIGGLVPGFADAIRAGSVAALNIIKRTDIPGIARALGISEDAAKIIKMTVENDDPAAAAAALKKAGAEGMLADSSSQASQLLDTTVAAGGQAGRIARDAVESRAAAASGQLRATMDATLGQPVGVKAAAGSISAKTAAGRKAAYDAAYATPIDYAAPEGRAIEEVLSRIPADKMRAAVKMANDAMQMQGIRNQQIMIEVADDGALTLREMPNVMQLDYIKRQLGELAAGEVDQFGRKTALGRALGDMANQLRDATGAAVPSYRTAVRMGGDKISEDKALAMGRNFMTMTREDVATAAKGMSVEASLAAKQGVREAFDEAMAKVKAVASDQNLDARQALNIVKEMSSEANRAKARSILGQRVATQLFAEFDKAATQLALRTATARNSATAARTAGKQAMDDIIQGGALQALKRGQVRNWSQGMIQFLTGTTKADDLAKAQKVYAEVAKALTEARGPAAENALKLVQTAMTGAPITEAQAATIAKAFAAASGFGGYQLARRSQTQPE